MNNLKEFIAKIKTSATTNSLTVSIVVFFLLLVGLVVTVDQATKQQTAQSRAASPDISDTTNCSMPATEAKMDADEKKLFKLVNDYRKSKNLNPLQEDEILIRAATWHSIDMAKNDYFDHKDSDKRLPPERVIDCGYYGEENQIRENLNAGTSSDNPEAVFEAWKKSNIHNETMLDETMDFGGIGYKYNKNAKMQHYWVLDVAQEPEISDDGNEEDDPTNDGDNDEVGCVVEEVEGDDDTVDTEAIANNTVETQGKKNDKKNDKKKDKKKNKKKQNKKNKKNGKPKPTCTPDPVDSPDNEECTVEELSADTQAVGAGGAMVGGNGNKKKSKKDDKKTASNNKKKKDDGKDKKDKDDKNKKKKNNNKKNNNDNNDNEETEPVEPEEPLPTCPPEDGDPEEPDDSDEEPERDPTERPTGPGIFFEVIVPGIGFGGNPEPIISFRDLSVQILDGTNKTVFDSSVDAEFDGNVFVGYVQTGSSIPTGKYQIKVKLPNSLRKVLRPEYQTIDATKQTTLKVPDLVFGDFDNNNVLNPSDFSIFRQCVDAGFLTDEEEEIAADEEEFIEEEEIVDETFDDEETTEEDEEDGVSTESTKTRVLAESCTQHEATDINDDGIVDMVDYNFLLSSYATLRGN